MIDKLLGDPDEVTARGQQIIDLGSDMAAAWSLISRLAADGAEMEGRSIDKLRELCEKVSSDLSEASELYAAVGPHIRTYGTSLASSQARHRPARDQAAGAVGGLLRALPHRRHRRGRGAP